MSYDFRSLSALDFESLVLDAIGKDLSCRFEAFSPGPDGGIDGRHASSYGTIILQAKHYIGSRGEKLVSTMRKERSAIDKLKPNRYILATSCTITPNIKEKLADIIGPSLQDKSDIYGPDDINQILKRNPAIEKAHIKLWLTNTTVLETILNSSKNAFDGITKDEICEKVRIYSLNKSFEVAAKKLDDTKVIIISGPPGVGKTTLAEMLTYTYLANGWKLTSMRDLDDGFASITDSENRVFFFDDFLGRVALDKRSLSGRDGELAKFIKRIRVSRNARFILTTRAYILEDARCVSEYLADERINIAKFVLDVGMYTRQVRAQILYNHLYFSDLSDEYINSLVSSGNVKKIIDHKNYNPRIVEWMSDTLNMKGIDSTRYAARFISALDDPSAIWEVAFRQHIDARCRNLLIVLFFLAEFGASVENCRKAFEIFHPSMCVAMGLSRDPKDFEDSLRILEGSFLSIKSERISYVNPSVRDFMSRYLNDASILFHCASICPTINWSLSVWQHGKRCFALNDDRRRQLGRVFESVLDSFCSLKAGQIFEYSVTGELDAAISERISALLEWWVLTRSIHFDSVALDVIEKLSGDVVGWRDGERIVEIIADLKEDDELLEFPFCDQLTEKLEALLLELLDGIASDELISIVETSEKRREFLSPQLLAALEQAIFEEFENVELYLSDISSEGTLEEYKETLKTLADKGGVDVHKLRSAIEMVDERLTEVRREYDHWDGPVGGVTAPRGEAFSDNDVENLFSMLRSYRGK